MFSDTRKVHILKVYENRLLRRTFGPKRDGMVEDWTKMCIEELHNLYCLPIIITVGKLKRMQ
jgi:hypothetical protein